MICCHRRQHPRCSERGGHYAIARTSLSARAFILGLGERLQEQALHAPGQGIGESAKLQQIGGSGQKNAPTLPVAIDTALDGQRELRQALDSDDCDRIRQPFEKTLRILSGEFQVVAVIQRDEGVFGLEGRLAALARAQRADHRHVAQRFVQRRRDVPVDIAGVRLPADRSSNCILSPRPIASYGNGHTPEIPSEPPAIDLTYSIL